jgi:hypothetical protein
MVRYLTGIAHVVVFVDTLLRISVAARVSGFRQAALRLRTDREYSALAEAEMMGSPLAAYAVSLKNKVLSHQFRDRQKEP